MARDFKNGPASYHVTYWRTKLILNYEHFYEKFYFIACEMSPFSIDNEFHR